MTLFYHVLPTLFFLEAQVAIEVQYLILFNSLRIRNIPLHRDTGILTNQYASWDGRALFWLPIPFGHSSNPLEASHFSRSVKRTVSKAPKLSKQGSLSNSKPGTCFFPTFRSPMNQLTWLVSSIHQVSLLSTCQDDYPVWRLNGMGLPGEANHRIIETQVVSQR